MQGWRPRPGAPRRLSRSPRAPVSPLACGWALARGLREGHRGLPSPVSEVTCGGFPQEGVAAFQGPGHGSPPPPTLLSSARMEQVRARPPDRLALGSPAPRVPIWAEHGAGDLVPVCAERPGAGGGVGGGPPHWAPGGGKPALWATLGAISPLFYSIRRQLGILGGLGW